MEILFYFANLVSFDEHTTFIIQFSIIIVNVLF